jgi:hypothetical protein
LVLGSVAFLVAFPLVRWLVLSNHAPQGRNQSFSSWLASSRKHDEDSVSARLKQIAETINSRVPLQVVPDVSLVQVTAEPKALIYNYIVGTPEAAVLVANARETFKATLARTYCNLADFGRQGFTVRAVFLNLQRDVIQTLDLSLDDCVSR